MHLEHPPLCPPSCTHCLAFDNITRALCSRTPSYNSKWCSVHEELQAKLLKSYKRLTLAFESFDDAVLPRSLDAVTDEQGLPQLRSWSEAARSKWSLAKRVIVARAEHHQQFYAGGDWGHTLFVETLKSETQRMERFLRALDRRAYAITLEQSQASWILDVPTGPSFVCNDGPASEKSSPPVVGEAPPTPPPTPPLSSRDLPSSRSPKPSRKLPRRKPGRQPSSSSSDPSSPPFSPTNTSVEAENDAFFAALSAPSVSTASPSDLLTSLRNYLTPPVDLASSVRGETWTAVVETLFRHVILRNPSLATLALSAELPSVVALLDVLEARLNGEEEDEGAEALVTKLWKALKFAKISSSEEADEAKGKDKESEEDGLLGVGVIVEALDVVFGGVEQEEQHVVLLGGKVWKNPRAAEWTREGWDLFYAFVACPGCSLIATRSLTTWTTNRRLAALGHLPAWLGSSESIAERIFRLSGVVLCTSNSCQAGRKVKRVEQKEAGKKAGKGGKAKKVVFVEEWERSWMYVKLPLNDPRSYLVLDHLASQPDKFAVLARKTTEDEVVFSPQENESTCSSSGRRCTCCEDSVWLNKIRSGFTPVERKAARWTTTSFFPRDSVLSSLLSSSSPESRFQPFPFPDTFDAVILDASPFSSATHDSWLAFADAVASAMLKAQECESVGELVWTEKKRAVERGEMMEGEWEAMRVCAAEQGKMGEGGTVKGRRGSKDMGEGGKKEKKVLYVCEDELTARKIFREE
ncbi:hypothetical protein JCM8547_004645 [Rhodosporidiobolus lusitaniae]